MVIVHHDSIWFKCCFWCDKSQKIAALTALIKLSRLCTPVCDVFIPGHTFLSDRFSAHHSLAEGTQSLKLPVILLT